MKRIIVFTLVFASVSFLSTSCKKACNLPEDSDSGAVVATNPANEAEIVVIYPDAGFLTDNMGGDYKIDENHLYADDFQVSFNGGATKGLVNYSQYNILGNPAAVSCDVAVDRNVVIDDANQLVTYTVTVTKCNDGCDELRGIENYVLVPDFPDTYNVIYNVVHN